MSYPRPLEEQILSPALRVLERVSDSLQTRFEVLEGAASRIGGFSLESYRKRFEPSSILTVTQAMDRAERLLRVLDTSTIPAALALSALARPRLPDFQKRSSGAYYTDFRLAQHVASSAARHLVSGARVIDPAAGTGSLLVAASYVACGPDADRQARWLAESVTAWDLSDEALRGARLALAALTDDLGAVKAMVKRWGCQDSLLVENCEWEAFDVVIANPPWERIKLTRHEFLKSAGGSRHYGETYERIDDAAFSEQRSYMEHYGNLLVKRYPLLGKGEPDFYKAFLELFLKLARPGGCISVLVPAGLIRSQGSEDLRRFVFESAADLSFTVMENRARFFPIDTRFKFVLLTLTKKLAGSERRPIRVLHAQGTDSGIKVVGRAQLGRSVLARIRKDLTLPEVRSEQEWRLFRTMCDHSMRQPLPTSPWYCEIVREVDMTRERKWFMCDRKVEHLPVIEGRMIHQYRFGAKAYRHGTGRRAKWDPVPWGAREIMPQFWHPKRRLPSIVRARVEVLRAGFCDITGQTNERSMLAAVVPRGVVCGNKVPTVVFPNDPGYNRLFLWLAIVNSFPFDWALRRIVTTTVNYFVLRSVPFPDIEPNSLSGRRLVKAARELWAMDNGASVADPWRTARLRASIDIVVHSEYGLELSELEHMLSDFPLLDRGQPPLRGERRSTVTRDFLLSHGTVYFRESERDYAARVLKARREGAIPYIPAEFISTNVKQAMEAHDG